MTDKNKLEKLKKLADAMYYAAQYLTTDASQLHKAMDEYHKFIIHECKEEPTIPDIVDEHFYEMLGEEPASEDLDSFAIKYAQDKPYPVTVCQAVKVGAKWQKEQDQSTIELAEDHAMLAGMEKMKEQMMAKAVCVTVHIDAGGYPYIPQIELYDYDKDIPLAKEGDKYKVVLIKEV